jgi:hypothetical protein
VYARIATLACFARFEQGAAVGRSCRATDASEQSRMMVLACIGACYYFGLSGREREKGTGTRA